MSLTCYPVSLFWSLACLFILDLIIVLHGFYLNNITNSHSHYGCVPPFYFQVKSDVRRLKGIPALVSMLDNPHREVSLLFFSKAFCSLFAVLEVCYDWAKSEA